MTAELSRDATRKRYRKPQKRRRADGWEALAIECPSPELPAEGAHVEESLERELLAASQQDYMCVHPCVL